MYNEFLLSSQGINSFKYMNEQFDLSLLMPVILDFPVNGSSIISLMFTLESILYMRLSMYMST